MTRARRFQVFLLAGVLAPWTAADLWAAQKNVQLVRAVTNNASGQLEFAKQVSGHGAGLAGLERGAVLDAPYEQSFKTGFQGGGPGAVTLPWVPADGTRPGASVPPGSTGPSAAEPVFTPGEDVTPWKSNLDRVGELRKQGYLWLGLALGLVAMAVPLLLLPLPWTKAAGVALLGAAFAAFLQARMQFENAKEAARELGETYAQAEQSKKADDQLSEEIQAAEEHREPGQPAQDIPSEADLAARGADDAGWAASSSGEAGPADSAQPRRVLAASTFAIPPSRGGHERVPGLGSVQVSADGPVPYYDLLKSLAEKHNVPVAFLAAVMMSESGGNPNAVGDHGHSVGLFQLHDRGMGYGYGNLRYDPVLNASIAAKALAESWHQGLRRGYRGEELVRFAYNHRFNPGGGWAWQGDKVVGYWRTYRRTLDDDA